MLGDLSVLEAEEIGGREHELIVGRRPSLIGAVLGAGPLHPRHDPVAVGHDLLDLGVVVRERDAADRARA